MITYNDLPLELRPTNEISQEAKEFYISFNTGDYFAYGAITTALVVGNNYEFFYILEGDHRENYKAIGNSLEKCLEYFTANSAKKSKYSDTVGEESAGQQIARQLREEDEKKAKGIP